MISRIYHVLKRPASFEDYLSEYNRFYIQKKEQEPEWLRSALLYKGFDSQYNEHTIRYLSSVKLMTDAYDYFWKLKNRFAPFETVPKEMLPFCREADDVFTGMYSEFMLNKDLYFVNKKSLTKEGGRRIRYYASFYPSFQKIEPVDSLLSSIPLSIERRGMTPRLLLLNCDEHPYMSMLK